MPNENRIQTETNESSPWIDDPIAITGIGLRLPGSVRTPQQYWDFLTKKGSGRCRVPANRYNVDAFLGPKGKPGHTCTEYGYFLDDVDLAAADSSFWSMKPKELELLDPQQRLMHEVVYECLESSGATAYSGKDIGCYVGVLGEDWMEIQTKDPQHTGVHSVAGYGDFAIANRVSKELGLTGPSMTIRTACSSSMMALHTACQSIYSGECSSAIVGGCSLILSPRMTVAMASEYRVISPTGYCRSFDATADGYARGEAVNAIHVKRLSHALRDGDPIRAVIRSVCLNSDGQRTPLLVPSPESHELLMRRSHQLAGISDLSQTAMIECHGTGTIVGDTLEGRAVAKVFGELGGVIIGSVKPNLGHSEGASGLSSIIKMVLALENQTIPPNIHFTTPNPKIPFGAARLRVPVECESWPTGKALRVGVNGFGIGGANGHVLLESATSFIGTDRKVPEANSSQLLVFSATHPQTLDRSITNTLEYVSSNPLQAADTAYTLGCRRKRFPHRAFAIGSANSWDVSAIHRGGKAPDLVWVFTGQGSQYPGMGKDLLRESSTARETIKVLDAVLNTIDPDRSWTLKEELLQPESSSQLSKAEYSQPCCTALQIALVDVLKSLNVRPSAVVGHSAGEIAAAYAAGGLNASEAITIAYHRGRVARQAEATGQGGMMAVSLGRDQTSRFLVDGTTIACENSPKSVTISGDSVALDVVAAEIRGSHPDAMIKRLPVQCAYHSAQMGSVAADYRSRLGSLAISDRPLSTQFVSSVTGKPVNSAGEFAPNYWCRNLISPVLFHSAIVETLSLGLSNPSFLEVGPHSALSGFLSDIGQGQRLQQIPYIPTLIRDCNSYEFILRTAGRLFQVGASIDLSTLCDGATLPDLPPYQWQYDATYWSESRVSRNWRFREHPNHDILGSKIPDGNDKEPIWRSLIYLDNVPWLRDHVVDGRVIFPRAGYISLVAEAICQLSGSSDLSMRNVHFLTELELFEKFPTEFMTQLRPSNLSATLDSEWYDFTITSFFDGAWTKHCTGQVRGGKQFSSETITPRVGARKVQPTVWQRAMKRVGVSYGPRFKLLQDISASVRDTEAAGTVIDSRERRESSYTLHPCIIDSMLQLLSVAKSQGLARLCKHQIMPTYIGEVYIKSVSGPLTSRAIINTHSAGAGIGNVAGFGGQHQPVISMRQIQLAPLGIGQSSQADPHAGARLVWKPDIDEVNISSLIRPIPGISSSIILLEELALACMIETHHQTRSIIPPLAHAAKFLEWLAIQRQLAEDGIYEHVPACQTIASMSSVERTSYIDNLYQKAVDTEARDMATAVTRIFRHSTGLFQCQVDPLSLLLKDNLLTAIYGFAQLCDFADFFHVLAHNRPSMRILEIGAGTGGVTATILPAMRGPNGERMYDSYTYTDISSGFFDAAQKRFGDYDGIIYRPLDITCNPLERGFEASSYDLIIASNVLHATPCLQETLANVKTLLKPGGKLFLQELAPTTKWINFIMGTLPGWWLGAADDRKWEPYISSERWDRELRNAGFSGADSVIHDGHMNAHIISSVQKPPTPADRRATVLCEGMSSTVDQFVSCLHNRGFSVDVRHPAEERPADQILISLLELDSPQLDSPIPDTYLRLQSLLTSLDTTPMLWVTKPSQVKCADPRYASTLGLLRTARRELASTVATIELDSLDLGAFTAAVTVTERLLLNSSSQLSLDPVTEYAYADGNLMVGKFYHAIISEEMLDNGVSDNLTPMALDYSASEEIKTLSWKTLPTTRSAFVDWVEVEVRAAGLDSDEPLKNTGIARQCAGIVLRAGPGVKNLRVGDQIIVLTTGPIATRFVTSERLCVRMARGLSWVEATTMPYSFATALYSLIDIARLKHGDTVLIHSACTGVGLAAIQICRIIGAQAFCTVETERETNHLVQLGVTKERIMSCRDSSFLQDILAATNRAGVDVVLNSLSGELLRASWDCVAEFGTLVELGKQNRVSQGQLAMNPFGTNRTFAAVDIVKIIEKKPAIIQGLLRRCMHHYALGELNPLPAEQFPAQNVQEALECLQQKTHIGSIALVMPQDTSALPRTLSRRMPRFRSDACHIIIGGLGGLGRSVSSWMSLHGARHFVFFSPSAGNKEDDDYVRELRAQGCRVDLVSGDVSNAQQVDALIGSLDQSIPVAGVMQASMALEVTALADMSFEQWQKSFAPKVQGTWNLHNSLQEHSHIVDYFVLFSSLSGLIGQTGHANYAAGNSFLDAFVQYRHYLGLAGSAVNIGVMEDVGYVSNQAEALEHFAAISAHMLHEQDLLDTIQLAIDNSLPDSAITNEERLWPSYVSTGQICIGLRSTTALDSPTNRTSWRRDPRMAMYHNFKKADAANVSGGQEAKNDDTLERFLAQAKLKPEILQEQESADILGREIGKALFNLMLREHAELDIDVPLSSLGADSLLAIKLRDWCRRTARVDITVVDIISCDSLRKLGRTAAVKMAATVASI